MDPVRSPSSRRRCCDLGTREVTRGTFLLPLVIVVAAGSYFLFAADDGAGTPNPAVGFGLVGVLFGLAAAAVTNGPPPRRSPRRDRRCWLRRALGRDDRRRLAFAEWANGAGARTVGMFSGDHAITGADAWTAASSSWHSAWCWPARSSSPSGAAVPAAVTRRLLPEPQPHRPVGERRSRTVALAVPHHLVTTSTRPIRTVLALVGISLGVTAVDPVVALVAPAVRPAAAPPAGGARLARDEPRGRARIGWAAVEPGTRPRGVRSAGWPPRPPRAGAAGVGLVPGPSTLVALTLGYAATGVNEELWSAASRCAPRSRSAPAARPPSRRRVRSRRTSRTCSRPERRRDRREASVPRPSGRRVLRLRTNALWSSPLRTPGPTCSCTRPACTAARCGPSWSARTWCCSLVGLVALRGQRRTA